MSKVLVRCLILNLKDVLYLVCTSENVANEDGGIEHDVMSTNGHFPVSSVKGRKVQVHRE